jgi:hypothetical protein
MVLTKGLSATRADDTSYGLAVAAYSGVPLAGPDDRPAAEIVFTHSPFRTKRLQKSEAVQK